MSLYVLYLRQIVVRYVYYITYIHYICITYNVLFIIHSTRNCVIR